jgi:hypothetical protein
MGLLSMPDRIGTTVVPGVQAGVLLQSGWRFAGRLVPLLGHSSERARKDVLCLADWERNDPSVTVEDSAQGDLIWGLSAGYKLGSVPGFSVSPAATFLHLATSDVGQILGISLAFQWIAESGLNVGFESLMGRAWGGHARLSCNGGCTPFTPSCTACGVAGDRVNRLATNVYYGHFSIGWMASTREGQP